ncbi:MAG: hypothetical protein EZS28_033814, partial [Streblomastix strix]
MLQNRLHTAEDEVSLIEFRRDQTIDKITIIKDEQDQVQNRNRVNSDTVGLILNTLNLTTAQVSHLHVGISEELASFGSQLRDACQQTRNIARVAQLNIDQDNNKNNIEGLKESNSMPEESDWKVVRTNEDETEIEYIGFDKER